jgi:hypothetical protein
MNKMNKMKENKNTTPSFVKKTHKGWGRKGNLGFPTKIKDRVVGEIFVSLLR